MASLVLIVAFSEATILAAEKRMLLNRFLGRFEGRESFTLPRAATTPHALARFRYDLICSKDHAPKTVPGLIITPYGRRIRFDLFSSTHLTEVDLGEVQSEDPFQIELISTQATCEIKNASLEIVDDGPSESPIEALVRAHSPFLVLRADQYSNRYTDLPVALAYSIQPTPRRTVVIKYTLFFTDEDSLTSSSDTDAQMGRYGRRNDIEWIYEVEVDARSGAVFRRQYQGDLLLGIGHVAKSFHGEFLANSNHPILYNIHPHNVFDDSPRGYQIGKPLEGYALIPKIEIPDPEAREDLMWQEPWIFLASDSELEFERKLSEPSSNSLFVRIQGSLEGEILLEVRMSDGSHFFSGYGNAPLDRLGEDLWGKTAYTAIAIGQKRLQAIRDQKLHGMIRVLSNPTSSRSAQLDLDSIRFRWLEISDNGLTARDFNSIRCTREWEWVCRF